MRAHLEESDDRVVLLPARPATSTVIWLHGLGADGHDFVPAVEALNLPGDSDIRFIFPHAPVRPVTLNHGMRMRAWYDIKSLALDGRADAEGLAESVRRVQALIAEQVAIGIEPSRIVLAGFSQGGAVALHTGLRCSESLAGLLALSTYLPHAGTLADVVTDAARNMPIQMHHGRQDGVLPLALGEVARDQLRAMGCQVDWHAWNMPHAVCEEQLRIIGHWLIERLSTL